MVAPGPLTLLLVSMVGLEHLPAAYDCLWRSFRGVYGARHAFVVDRACLLSSFSLLELGTGAAIERADNLVWVARDGAAPADPARAADEFDALLSGLRAAAAELEPAGPQAALGVPEEGARVVHRAQDGVFLSVGEAALQSLERALPEHWNYSVVPASPRPLLSVAGASEDRARESDARPLVRLYALSPVLGSRADRDSIVLSLCH